MLNVYCALLCDVNILFSNFLLNNTDSGSFFPLFLSLSFSPDSIYGSFVFPKESKTKRRQFQRLVQKAIEMFQWMHVICSMNKHGTFLILHCRLWVWCTHRIGIALPIRMKAHQFSVLVFYFFVEMTNSSFSILWNCTNDEKYDYNTYYNQQTKKTHTHCIFIVTSQNVR